MRHQMTRLIAASGLLIATFGSASAAEPVVGNWRTALGEIASIAPCGDAFCISLTTGKFKGRQIGRMSGSAGTYEGEITDPQAERTYAGKAEVAGASLKLTGCALKVFCKTQSWTKR
ncbi:DUF2147 domain-containing protein [Aureimonas sp. D3]|uniref:DUF2147 domain-containing protein n=1 Tax=Aureimonas sp. D3 TaxID=1638164 RepID=UPI0009ECB41E|nr:DUF2147 domain-containing protein [Aureimonas sp. D3]